MLQVILRFRFFRQITFLLATPILFTSCYTYNLSTRSLPGTEFSKTTTASSFFWGLAQKPANGISAGNCDSLGLSGMQVVQIKTNVGYALITVATLGIWCPIQVRWKCNKPCAITDSL